MKVDGVRNTFAVSKENARKLAGEKAYSLEHVWRRRMRIDDTGTKFLVMNCGYCEAVYEYDPELEQE